MSITHIFHGITLSLALILGCTYNTYDGPIDEQSDDQGELGEPMTTVYAALTNMVRTDAISNATIGLPFGNPLTSIQTGQLEPGVYTLAFTVLPPADGQGFAAYALVTWKVGGQQITRKISVFSGAAITGVCDSVDVKLVDVSQVGVFGFPATPLSYQIGVSLSKGGRATTMQPATLVTQLQSLPIDTGGVNPSSVTFLVPPDAGVISVLPIVGPAGVTNPLLTTDIDVVQLNQAATVLMSSWYPMLQNPGWIPLFGGTVRVGITTASANVALVNVIWGIEG